MVIKTEDVKKIREETGAGIMDCKKALEKAEGNYQAALIFLKEQGIQIVKKKENRVANEGKIFIKATNEKAGMVYLACETDFVARNAEFNKLGTACLESFYKHGYVDNNQEIVHVLHEAVAKIKENIFLKNYKLFEVSGNEILKTYLHNDGRICAMLKIRMEPGREISNSNFENLVNDIVLHIAAFTPVFIERNAVPAAYINEQLQKFTEETSTINKPEKIKVGIVKGKLEKHLKNICLMEQPFIRDDKHSVSEAIQRTALESNITFQITDFFYCKVGE